jgi:hypothetical protein
MEGRKRGTIAANFVGKIDYWPLSYISLNAYLVICALVGLSLIFCESGCGPSVFCLRIAVEMFCINITTIKKRSGRKI